MRDKARAAPRPTARGPAAPAHHFKVYVRVCVSECASVCERERVCVCECECECACACACEYVSV